MKTIKNGRRQFLANFALLSTGVVFAGPASLGRGKPEVMGLEAKWRSLTEKLNGCKFYGPIIYKDPANYLQPCAGHHYAIGQPVSFVNNSILAVPVWIYWQNSNKPADMVVSFFKSDGLSKLCTLNRYELETLAGTAFKPGGEIALFQLLENNLLLTNDSLVITSIRGSQKPETKASNLLTSYQFNQNLFINI